MIIFSRKSVQRLVSAVCFALLWGVAQAPLSQAWAQEDGASAPAKTSQAHIAVIDIQKILRESKAAISLREQLDEVRRNERNQIVKREDSLSDEQQELNRQRTVLSPEAYDKKLRALERKAASLSLDLETRKQEIDLAFENSLTVIRTNLVTVVREIAGALGANIVLAKSQVLLVDAELDITQAALESLNAQLPEVSFEVAKAKSN